MIYPVTDEFSSTKLRLREDVKSDIKSIKIQSKDTESIFPSFTVPIVTAFLPFIGRYSIVATHYENKNISSGVCVCVYIGPLNCICKWNR